MLKNVFILDDNAEILEILENMLEPYPGLSVHTFRNPTAALRKIESGTIPDLIITDLKMAPMSGIEFLARITQHHKGIKTIIFTGRAETLPPGCMYETVFKDAHGFDQLIFEMERLLFPDRERDPAATHK